MNNNRNPWGDKQKVDLLNEELYYKNKEFGQRKRRKIHSRNIHLKHDFNEETYQKLLKKHKKRILPTSLFKKIFLGTLFFFIITAIIAVMSLYTKREEVSDKLISMEVLGQPSVDAGEDLELHVRIQNFNKKELQYPDLVLSYKKDSSSKEDDVFLRRGLPNIGIEERVDEKFNLRLFGKSGDVRKIHIRLEYRIPGSTSIFVKEMEHEIIIRSTQTKLVVRGPEEVVAGQEIHLDIDISANTSKTVRDMLLDIDYPLGFEFISSNIKPKFSTHTWYFESVPKKAETLSIVGRVSGLPNQGQSFHVRFGKQDPLQKNVIATVFNETTYTFEIQESFLNVSLRANGQEKPRVVIRGGEEVGIVVEVQNNLDRNLQDVQVVAHLVGDLYNPKKIQALEGEYDSNRKIITWNKDTVSDFENFGPNTSHSLSLNIQTKDLVDSSHIFKKPNFGVIVDVSATDTNGNVRQASAVRRVDLVANSDLTLLAKTYYNDGPFNNNGPIPPRVGKKTQYTLTFQVRNSSNDIENAEMSTFLPPYVTWLNTIYPSSEKNNVSYNQTTREVKWNIGKIPAGIGVGATPPRELSFQVDILPSLSHIETLPKLTRDIILSGDDTFTGTHLKYKKSPLTTKLSDASVESGSNLVVE